MVYLKLSDLNAYQISYKLSNDVWSIVTKWKWFEKQTIGTQIIRSTDSIGANIAEGFGRYHKKDREKFYYYARGSVYESVHWIRLSYQRTLMNKKEASDILQILQVLPREINHLIKFTEINLKK